MHAKDRIPLAGSFGLASGRQPEGRSDGNCDDGQSQDVSEPTSESVFTKVEHEPDRIQPDVQKKSRPKVELPTYKQPAEKNSAQAGDGHNAGDSAPILPLAHMRNAEENGRPDARQPDWPAAPANEYAQRKASIDKFLSDWTANSQP